MNDANGNEEGKNDELGERDLVHKIVRQSLKMALIGFDQVNLIIHS